MQKIKNKYIWSLTIALCIYNIFSITIQPAMALVSGNNNAGSSVEISNEIKPIIIPDLEIKFGDPSKNIDNSVQKGFNVLLHKYQSKVFTEWMKTACADTSGPQKEICYKQKLSNIQNLYQANLAASSKLEQKIEACNNLPNRTDSSSARAECKNDANKSYRDGVDKYLKTPNEQFIKNKTYQEDIKIIDEEYKKSEKSCNKLHFSSERVSCLNKAKKARSISQCVAGKTLRKTNFGDKYHSASYGGDIKKAKEAMKKDCEEEFKKKSASLNKTTN